ncbi:metal-sensitive transcriptional regulator [Sporosarcina sp. CAU 1771]
MNVEGRHNMSELAKSTIQPNKKQLLNRLKRVEGQVRGVHQMIEDDRYCVDILHQISAIQSAINKVSLALLEDHTHHCVVNAIKGQDGEAAIQELMSVMKTMTK